MRFDELNESNYLLFAIKFYDNPQAVTKDDFESDLKRIRYVKRLLKRYKNSGELKVHLILNHLIVLFLVFTHPTVPLLFYYLSDVLSPSIIIFLLFLNLLPDYPNTLLYVIATAHNCLAQLKALCWTLIELFKYS